MMEKHPNTSRAIMHAKLQGYSNSKIAKELGLSTATIDVITENPLFQQEFKDLEREADRKADTASLDVRTLLQKEALESARKLVELRSYGSEKTQLASALAILDRAGHSPVQRVDHVHTVMVEEKQSKRMEETYHMIEKDGTYIPDNGDPNDNEP